MSLLQNTYETCKRIWVSPYREKLRDTITNLSVVGLDEQGGPNDRSMFGYIARRQNAQFLGYLMVDQERVSLEQEPMLVRLPALQSEKRQLLAGAHMRIVHLNMDCISSLTTLIPNCAHGVNPYGAFNYKPAIDFNEIDIIDNRDMEVLAKSFQMHPAIQIAIEDANTFAQRFSERDYVESISKINGWIARAGVLKAPKQLDEAILGIPKTDPNRIILRHLIAQLCLRASLESLNQLIFQAVLNNKLSVISEDNIIEIQNAVRHLCGHGLSILIQPTAEFKLEPNDLILVKLPDSRISHNMLCCVEEYTVSQSQEFGTTMRVDLREIDDNLNPYGGLLARLQ